HDLAELPLVLVVEHVALRLPHAADDRLLDGLREDAPLVLEIDLVVADPLAGRAVEVQFEILEAVLLGETLGHGLLDPRDQLLAVDVAVEGDGLDVPEDVGGSHDVGSSTGSGHRATGDVRRQAGPDRRDARPDGPCAPGRRGVPKQKRAGTPLARHTTVIWQRGILAQPSISSSFRLARAAAA